MPTINSFYVYEHWRPDTNACFYVGKGVGDRAYRRRRGKHHSHVVAKLSEAGQTFDVRFAATDLSEAAALALEIDLIARRRAQGAPLTNVTCGGEGVSGLRHSAATKARLSALAKTALIGRPVSEKTRAKISESQKGRSRGPNPGHSKRLTGRKLSTETKQAMSSAQKGRVVRPATRELIAVSRRGKVATAETKARLSAAHKGNRHSEETRRKMSEGQSRYWAARRAGAI